MSPDTATDDLDAPLFFSEPVPESENIVPQKRVWSEREANVHAWKRRYMGTFVLCGYSMTKGYGHVRAGERVLIQRKSKNHSTSSSKTQHRSREKTDYIVRFSTTRGFEVGRIPVDVASWMSRLLDDQLVEFDGCIVDTPAKLEVGSDILLQVKAYICYTAFTTSVSGHYHLDDSLEWSKTSDAKESTQERLLRHRKVAWQRLFLACHLVPKRGNTSLHTESTRSWHTTRDADDDGTEVTSECIQDMYTRSEKSHANLPIVDPPATFALELRSYQKEALGWMQSMEDTNYSFRQNTELHPLWEEYEFPLADDMDCGHGPFYMNPYIGELSLVFQPASRAARGGILADEMGLGKTIMLASLIHANRSMDLDRPPTSMNSSRPRSAHLRQASLHFGKAPRLQRTAATLVVAPMSLLSQWRTELDRASQPGTLSIALYYGDAREQLAQQLAKGEADVVITSYGTLTAEYKHLDKRGTSTLFSGTWHRVILDEAHTIKNRSTLAARAACRLEADRRWALTGTPIQNRLTDLYSLLRFLRVEPWGDIRFFNSFLAKPFASQNAKALDIVQAILSSLLLRREKHTPGPDGRPIVDIPPKTWDTQHLTFSATERDIYLSVYDRARTQYRELAAQGLVGKNVSLIFAVLMRLRQAVCHPYLVLQKHNQAPEEQTYEERLRELVKRYEAEGNAGSTYARDVLGSLLAAAEVRDEASLQTNAGDNEVFENSHHERFGDNDTDEEEECPFCMELKASKCFLPRCMHHGCRDCLVQYLQACEDRGEEPHCPVCRQGPVQVEDLVESVRPTIETSSTAASAPAGPARGSTKLNALMQQLAELTQSDPTCKGVIFSQFTGFLNLIQAHLVQRQYAFVRLDGRTPQKEREHVLRTFANEPGPFFLLMSLRAGGVGLNCTFLCACTNTSSDSGESCVAHGLLVESKHVCCKKHETKKTRLTPVREDQAIDRVHRLGQSRAVTVHRLLVNDTIEDRILEIQRHKKQLVDHALSIKPYSADSDTLENLRLLFD